VFKPVKMAKIAIMGLRKNQQTAVSVLHDMEVLQLEPLSKDVSAIVKNERNNELTRQVSDQLLRIKSLMTVLPRIPVTARKRFDSVDELLQTANSIDIDEQVANLEKEKEGLLTQLNETENNLKLIEEFSFFPEDLKILQLSSATSYFGRIPSDKFEEFKKTIDAHQQDIMLYTKAEKDLIVNKIKKAKTDPMPMPTNEENLEKRPEAENLLGIYSSLSNQTLEQSKKEFNGKNFSDFKEKLSDLLVEKIDPISKEIKKLLNDEKHLDNILFDGSQKADRIASKKIKEIKKLIGF